MCVCEECTCLRACVCVRAMARVSVRACVYAFPRRICCLDVCLFVPVVRFFFRFFKK